jgi:hypothetical protein
MEHIFHKIILNIYFDHIHIICLYRVFSVHCTGYMLVIVESRSCYASATSRWTGLRGALIFLCLAINEDLKWLETMLGLVGLR